MNHDKHPNHFIYIVRCSDGTLYTGWTHDVEKRVAKYIEVPVEKYQDVIVEKELVIPVERIVERKIRVEKRVPREIEVE